MRKTKINLTKREKECLALAANGYTIAKSAAFLDLRTDTIKAHRRTAVKKLHCHNVTHAVFYCTKIGIALDL